MYSTDQKYKIQLKTGIQYTGLILEEDSINIKIQDRDGEEIIISKDEIRQSKLIGQNRTGVIGGRKRT